MVKDSDSELRQVPNHILYAPMVRTAGGVYVPANQGTKESNHLAYTHRFDPITQLTTNAAGTLTFQILWANIYGFLKHMWIEFDATSAMSGATEQQALQSPIGMMISHIDIKAAGKVIQRIERDQLALLPFLNHSSVALQDKAEDLNVTLGTTGTVNNITFYGEDLTQTEVSKYKIHIEQSVLQNLNIPLAALKESKNGKLEIVVYVDTDARGVVELTAQVSTPTDLTFSGWSLNMLVDRISDAEITALSNKLDNIVYQPRYIRWVSADYTETLTASLEKSIQLKHLTGGLCAYLVVLIRSSIAVGPRTGASASTLCNRSNFASLNSVGTTGTLESLIKFQNNAQENIFAVDHMSSDEIRHVMTDIMDGMDCSLARSVLIIPLGCRSIPAANRGELVGQYRVDNDYLKITPHSGFGSGSYVISVHGATYYAANLEYGTLKESILVE